MTLRPALYLSFAILLAGCVRTGGTVDPMSTKEGRAQARDAYIQLGIGHLQQGSTERAKEPLRKALAWVWAALICLSTVFTKQHSVIDVACGLAVAFVWLPVAYRRVRALH